LALTLRTPRGVEAEPRWRRLPQVAVGSLIALAIILATMFWVDIPTARAVARLPQWVPSIFDEVSDYGTSDWFLVPTGVILLGLAALATPAVPHMSRLIVVALAVRVAFIFEAIALPGLFVTVIKRLIGRARPYVGDTSDPFLYAPFAWRAEYASLPSGHATNVFAALVAIGLLFPRLRAVMLLYALAIAAARVFVSAHHVSDVMAGAVVGTVGALLVRDWFAARRLGFVIEPDGCVHSLPGPSFRRLWAVARQLLPA
jgi:undecaprenyl-diphosphatase